MSVLETPRIYFKGEVSWDPIVTNNTPSNYDENDGETVYPPPPAPHTVQAFRSSAIQQVVAAGNWNPHGTHRSVFYNSSVCGVDTGGGLRTDDPFVNAAANFKGMLVDLEPYGTLSSQLFFDAISFGIDGGYRISAPRSSRFIARYINFNRNSANQMIAGVASVVWQTSFPKNGSLRIDAFESAALKSLSEALQADDVLGLTIRLNVYRTIYFGDPTLTNGSPAAANAAQELLTKLTGGGFQPNPARSLMVGVIGLWRRGEPAQEPGERMLVQSASPASTSSVNLGSAYVLASGASLTLDLSNSIPEIDQCLTKQDLGTLNIVAVDPATNATIHLGSFGYSQYDRTAYEGASGIVTIPLATGASDLAGKNIQITDSLGTVLFVEMPQRLIPTTPNLYLDEGAQGNATFQLYERGVPAAKQVAFTLYQVTSSGSTTKSQANTDANGVFTLPLTAGGGSILAYVPGFTEAEDPTQNGINPQVNTYMYVRVRPADNAIAELAPTWDNVYANVLANWNAMAPCMDNWLNLASPDQIRAFGATLKGLTNPANFESFLFMPVTRDMSAGERTLLYKFLDAPSVAAAAVSAPARKYVRLSRAMRGR